MANFADKRPKAKFKNSVTILIYSCFKITALVFAFQATVRKYSVEPQIDNPVARHLKFQQMSVATDYRSDVSLVKFSGQDYLARQIRAFQDFYNFFPV